MSKYQLIFTKIGICIDIVELWSGITSGQILSVFGFGLLMGNSVF